MLCPAVGRILRSVIKKQNPGAYKNQAFWPVIFCFCIIPDADRGRISETCFYGIMPKIREKGKVFFADFILSARGLPMPVGKMQKVLN